MEKIKSFILSEKGKDICTVLIVILVGISSFFLGRLSKVQKSDFRLTYPANYQESLPAGAFQADLGQINTNISENRGISVNTSQNATGDYFASKIGHKYYPVGCAAGKSLKLENRIYFKTSAEAESAGYTLSSSCN